MVESHTLLSENVVAVQRGRFGNVVAMTAALLVAVVAAAVTSTMVTIGAVLPRGDARSVTGYNCFKTASGKGRCMRSCTPGGLNGTCEGVAPHMQPAVEQPGGSLFCFSVYTANHGGPKPSHELELLQLAHERSASLFSCAEWAVYSDVVAPLGGGDMTIQVTDVKGDFHLMKRKEAKTWVNTGMFVQVWNAIHDAGHYSNHNWVIKVDADAVFFPHKLLNQLQGVSVPASGLYVENCKFVDWGYFGNLEVFSKTAFETLVQNVETCYSEVPWKVGVHGGKYGPMGEDLFAQKCMDMMGVGRQENFGLTTDGACEADRPEGQKKNKKFIPNCVGVSTPSIHPFKKPEAYAKCLEEAASA